MNSTLSPNPHRNRFGAAFAAALGILFLSAGGALAAGHSASGSMSAARATAVNGVELGGPLSFSISGATLDMRAGSLCNHGSKSETNNIRLELWAVAQPYAGGAVSGTKLGESDTQNGLFQNQCYNNFDSHAVTLLHTPPNGTYFVVLFLAEYENAQDDDGYVFDDYGQFPNTISVSNGVITVSAAGSGCNPDATTLCIDDTAGDRRFQVRASFSTSQGGGQSGSGHAVGLSTLGVNQGGLFWFFSANNPELLVKVLDGCGANSRHWVFASAGTNVGVTLTVTDTKTGAVKVYTNPDLQSWAPIQDTAAFPCS